LACVLALGSMAVAPAIAQEGGFDARFAAARAEALDGKRDAAIAAYTALLAESPGNTDVLLGWTYLDLGIVRVPTPSYFLLERWAPVGEPAIPPKR
jgi:hypothetical protein